MDVVSSDIHIHKMRLSFLDIRIRVRIIWLLSASALLLQLLNAFIICYLRIR
jgi:hypothetical protein